MKNETVVRKTEYDRYLIPLPFSKLLGKKKTKFIFSELEKRHPCFSSKYCFDSRIRFGKKGILSDVIVMDKGKYSAYRNRGGIYLEGLRFKRFRKDFFFILFPFFLLGVGICFVLCVDDLEKTDVSYLESRISEEHKGNELKSSSDFMGEEDLLAEQVFLLESIFRNLEKSNGRLSFLNWSLRDGKEIISMQLNDMSPDAFLDFRDEENFFMSAVSYEGRNSKFSVSCERKVIFSPEEEVFVKKNEFLYQKELRSLLLDEKCILVEEKYFPYSVHFKFNNFKIFKSLSDFLRIKELHVKDLSLKEESAGSFSAELFFEDGNNSKAGLNLDLLEKSKNLFWISKKQSVSNVGMKSHKGTNVNENLKKIGEVKYVNGSKLVFYKDRNGKVIKRDEKL